MTQLTSLDAAEITTWLTRVTQTIDRSLRDGARTEALAALGAGLEGTKVSLPVLAQLALLDDCLRVAHLAIEADGRIEHDELARVSELVRVAAGKYFYVLPLYESFDEGTTTPAEVARFLRTHRADPAAYGYLNPSHWRGLDLVRLVEHATHNASPLREHERMLARIMDEVFAGRATEVEREARRKLRALFERPLAEGTDPRAVAFCRHDGPEVFSSVAHGSHVHERDPFDVDAIHAEAREVFHLQLERATTPEHSQRGQGRTLLVLGEAGAGKTHLLRAFRTHVHGQRRGYVGYLQMSSEVGDYTRYVLRNLIDSMERPYDAPALSESALMYLSDGLAAGRVQIPPDELEQLRTAELEPAALQTLIGRLADRVVRIDGLDRLEIDLVHALLLLQRRDPALQRRVIKFLRCEPLSAYDSQLLGGLVTRDQPEDPLRTITQLAAMMHELQLAALVLLVDQIEEAIPDGTTIGKIQQAFDTLRAIADAVPSSIVVIACLQDVYDAVRPRLTRSLVDRLERDPGPVRLTSQREVDEIEQMLVTRLEHLYAAFDVAWRDDDPIYPFQRSQIDAVAKLRARDCLAKFREYHNACIAAQAIVGSDGVTAAAPPVTTQAPAIALDTTWNEALVATTELPDDDDALLAVLETAIRSGAAEAEFVLDVKRVRDYLIVEGPALSRRVVAICNHATQGGALGRQLDALRKLADGGAIPIALRESDFEFSRRTKIAQQVGALIQAGGRTIVLEEREVRAALAARSLAQHRPQPFADWRRARRPIASLPFVRALLDLDHRNPVAATAPVAATPRAPVPPPPEPRRASAPIVAVGADQIRLGVMTTLKAETVHLPLEQVKQHAAFLGGTGSGKTTAALSVVEQLLERGISVLLVDRKGDLARYASRAWWTSGTTHDPARRTALAGRVQVALYTPGNAQGRPLRLPLIPSLSDATAQERERLAEFAANGLATMMGYGKGVTYKYRHSVLQCAIQLHAEEHDITLDALMDTINRPDPELLRKVSNLQRHFAGLAEDLQTLHIQRGSLLAGDGEALDLDALLPPPGDRPRLSIINTSALTEVSVLQFWVSRLLTELSRLARRRPSRTLQAAAFFDEADAYVPAVGSPPTKEPMFDLLRRARSTGIGVLLATQNPGDFDYKARDNIGTWLVGKVAQDRAIEKMRNLLSGYPNVAPRLATQTTGHFFVLTAGEAREIKCDRSLMQTEQLSEQEVTELARRV